MLKPIHPFPARMAPEIALETVSELPPGSIILDPMAGSGTVLRVASDAGHTAIGYDLDPLAVLMAKVWTTPIDPDELLRLGETVLDRYDRMDKRCKVSLPWIDDDPSTNGFIDRWFIGAQKRDCRRLSFLLRRSRSPAADALRISFSRVIIRKEGGASMADDVSHSRPHRRNEVTNDFDVIQNFERAFTRVAKILRDSPPQGRVTTRLQDGRLLKSLRSNSVSSIINSPPYLNAIDYMRGHRLTLVWFGYKISTLASIRSACIGAERAPDVTDRTFIDRIARNLGDIEKLPKAQRSMVSRYIMDLKAAMASAYRVLRPGGDAVFVVGNSCLRGVFIKNSSALISVAQEAGFQLVDESERNLPPNRRYLPPPTSEVRQHLQKRMRTEVVLRFKKPTTQARSFRAY